MRELWKKESCIQIEITNQCNKQCPNCSRFVGHHQKPYFMTLEQIEEALTSLDGFQGEIGIMGGETTLHPQFEQICKILQNRVKDKSKRGLWTDGLNWNKYESIIRETFPIENIVYNDHDYEYKGQHQPLLIAANDIIQDKPFMWELINKCWVQERWSASINKNGAFFCEVAAAMAMLFNEQGWSVQRGWWGKAPKDFRDQSDKYCIRCSAAIPFSNDIYDSCNEYVSKSNIYRLQKIQAKNLERFKLYDKPYTREDYAKNFPSWKPGQFRDFYQYEPHKRIYCKKNEKGEIIERKEVIA